MDKKRIPVGKIILATVAVAGIIAALAVAPAVGPALRVFGLGKGAYPSRYINDATRRLLQKGLVVFEEREGKRFLRITEKGKRVLRQYQRVGLQQEHTRKWDGKWRLITFDIKEVQRGLRNKLRRELVNLGLSLAEIASGREMTIGTIISHLEKLKELGVEMNFEKFKPNESDLRKIKEAFAATGDTKLSPVHRLLCGEYSYDDIRLARLFL